MVKIQIDIVPIHNNLLVYKQLNVLKVKCINFEVFTVKFVLELLSGAQGH